MSGVRPGRAQTSGSARFAFADTTLLRDTLDLHFDGLFPLADSLQVLPDTLRALSIRFRLPLPRIVLLADSLGVPVDSVGPMMERERFNPLARGGANTSSFTYSSGYSVQQTSSSWSNTADYSIARGPVFVRNNTVITVDRYRVGGQTQLRENRTANTEGGWKFSPNFSLGARANLDRFGNSGSRSSGESDDKSEFQLSARSRQTPMRGLSSDLNFFGGLLDFRSFAQQKRGFSGDVNGRVRYASGSWLTHDATGQVTGNLSRTRSQVSDVFLNTRDFSNNLRGTLGLWGSAPVSLNMNYGVRNVRVENPSADSIIRVLTNNRSLDAAMRMRLDNERYLNLSRRYSRTAQASAQTPTSQNQRLEDRYSVTGRWAYRALSFDGGFDYGNARSEYPKRSATGGYRERSRARSVDGTLTWVVSRKVNAKLTGDVSLTSLRYEQIGSFASTPVNREAYRQSLRGDVGYQRSERLNTSGAFTVSRDLSLNLPRGSTAANSETRQYQAEWRWSYRLFQGLTAVQTNRMSANYTRYLSSSSSGNNRLSLDYSTFTTLNAVLTERLNMDLSHSARFQPSGNLVRFADGNDYLRQSDQNESFALNSQISYSPVPGISLQIQPQYSATNRLTASNVGLVPQREQRTLKVSGGANLNLTLPMRGRLSGFLNRSFSGDRSTQYSNGVVKTSPVTELDFWNGSLQVTWDF